MSVKESLEQIKVCKRDTSVKNRNNRLQNFVCKKALDGAIKAIRASKDVPINKEAFLEFLWENLKDQKTVRVSVLQNLTENYLMNNGHQKAAIAYRDYKKEHERIREYVVKQEKFIENYKKSSNTANATIDDNSNVGSKNIGVMNAEIHKLDNILVNRGMMMRKLAELFPELDCKQYIRDLEHHSFYKNDESSFAGATAPYCVSISMYPFLEKGLKALGGLSAKPKNLDSFCGMFVNLVFAISAQFAGAIATPEFFVCFDYFARKKWGDNYHKYADGTSAKHIWYDDEFGNRVDEGTIGQQIKQYFQQVVYSINQPAAARGMQAAFVNFAYFDKSFYDGMFENFYFPDGTRPQWQSINWLQKYFMQWFNDERTKCMLTFPVESFALVYKDGKFADEENATFVAEEYSRGHSFFTYISDTADSLSSCCRLKNKIQTKEFNFTNGNMGVMTGSKSVMTLNLNRVIQDWFRSLKLTQDEQMEYRMAHKSIVEKLDDFCVYLDDILGRIYKYQITYDALLKDMYNSGLLPVYSAGFISLEKQYLTIGINGLNEAAEFFGIECNINKPYEEFCQKIFGHIKEQNEAHKSEGIMFNTECVPAESLAIKNYNWDKADGYWVPETRNLYASYIYIPSDDSLSVYDKIILHGKDYIGEYLDGGSAAHLNLSEHLSVSQYENILKFAADNGCQYLTFNIPNCECDSCGHIEKKPFDVCPVCGGTQITLWDRVIGYLTAIKNWSNGRQIEQKSRIYLNSEKIC